MNCILCDGSGIHDDGEFCECSENFFEYSKDDDDDLDNGTNTDDDEDDGELDNGTNTND